MDDAFLQRLYATTRTDELADVLWPDAAKAQFLASQFAFQHRHFVGEYPRGDFLIVTRRGQPIGRLYLNRAAPMWRLIDIAILPDGRGGGVGTALIRWLQRAASAAGAAGVELNVRRDNAGAARLYASLGFFEAISASASHRRMAWQVAIS